VDWGGGRGQNLRCGFRPPFCCHGQSLLGAGSGQIRIHHASVGGPVATHPHSLPPRPGSFCLLPFVVLGSDLAAPRCILVAASAFLWRGWLERLAWDELHTPPSRGSLGLTCVATRAQALLAKQACHRIAGGGRLAAHIAYWLGLRLHHRIPALAAGPHTEVIPASYAALGRLLLDFLDLDDVDAAALGAVEAKSLYAAFTDTLPPLKVEVKQPEFDWRKVWSRLVSTGLPPLAIDTAFSMLHNILPLQVRRHCLQFADSPACRLCGVPVEDALYFFTACPHVVDAWAVWPRRRAGRLAVHFLTDTFFISLFPSIL
jgi:hypothetical protein